MAHSNRKKRQSDPGRRAARTLARIVEERPSIIDEHTILFRWPGPGLYKESLNGILLRHCYPTKQISISERCVLSALKAGFQYVGWAQP